MLSAYDEADRKLAAFEAGADDYVTKPCSCEELFVRIVHRVNERRRMAIAFSTAPPPATQARSVIEIEELTVDRSSKSVLVKGEQRPVKRADFRLLEELAVNRGRVVLKSDISRRSGHTISEETVRWRVSSLRKALGPAGHLIETRHGQGYMIR